MKLQQAEMSKRLNNINIETKDQKVKKTLNHDTVYYLAEETAYKTMVELATEMWKRGMLYTDDNVIPLQA